MSKDWLRVACPALFVFYALAISLSLAWNIPPFLAADEGAHLHRANLLTHGRLMGERLHWPGPPVSGGPTDRALFEAGEPFDDEMGHPDNTADRSDFTVAGAIHWDDRQANAQFSGSAFYPPFFYLPASAGLWLGKTLGLTVLQSVYAARALNAIACALIGGLALAMAGRARLAMFAILLLPMATALYGAPTQDGLALATTALGVACISRALSEGRPMRTGEVAVAAITLALLAMTKPPYLLLMLVLVASPAANGRSKALIVLLATAVACAWQAWTAATIQTPLVKAGILLDPGGQVAYLIGNPLAIPQLAYRTLAEKGQFYWDSFIGVLGWLDTVLGSAYYKAAGVVLVIAFAGSASLGRDREWRRLVPATILAGVLCAGGIFLALYVIWSAVGAPVVDGVQGRYFLPLALFAPLLIEGKRQLLPRGWGNWVEGGLAAIVLAFPLVTLLVVERAVILRYYLD